MSGALGHFGIALESDWGTPVAATDYIEILNESLALQIERYETRNVVAGFHEPDDEAGLRRYAGDIAWSAHPVNLGYALNGVLGVNSVTSLGGGLFLNEFTRATAMNSSLHPLPPYTVEVFRPSQLGPSSSFQYTGVQFNALEMSVAPNAALNANANVIAKDQAFITKTTAAFPSTPSRVFTFETMSLSTGGTGRGIDIEAFNLSIDNGLTGEGALNGTTAISKVRRDNISTTRLGGTIEFVDHADYEIFKDQTEQAVVATFFMANSHQLVIDVPRAVFIDFPIQIPGRNRLTVAFQMMGRYHTGSSSALKIDLTTTNTF